MENQSSIEEIDEITRQFNVTIPADEVAREMEVELTKLRKNAKIKGFRQGKVPQNVLEKHHGARVRMEVAHRLISSSLTNLVKEHALDVVGEPQVDISSFEDGKDIEFKASVSLFPTPEIKKYERFKVEVEKRDVQDKDVDEFIEHLRESKASPVPLSFRTTAEKGDVIDAALEVDIKGEQKNPSEPLVIALGEGNLPPELEEGILGMEIGDHKEIVSKIPENHGDKNLRGRECVYKITLNALSEKVLPELNDEFAKSLQMEVETLLELRMKAREQLEEKAETDARADMHAKILDQLLDANSFLVPQVIIDDEIRGLLVRSGMVDVSKIDPMKISIEPFRKELSEIALKRVRTAIIVDRIAENENLKATAEDLEKVMNDISEKNNLPLEEVQKFFNDAGRKSNFELEQTRNKVLDFLTDRADVKYVAVKEEGENKA